MRLMKFVVGALMMSAVALSSASPADPKNGVEYKTLPAPQPVDTGKKVEVLEFFDYYCPHCFAFDPSLTAWVKKQGDAIVFKRVHVSRTRHRPAAAAMFFTLSAMGLLNDAMHTRSSTRCMSTATA
jgi:thiol:disulfide interchange protein DsbA